MASNLDRLRELVNQIVPKINGDNPPPATALESVLLGMFESAPDGIILIEAKGKILMANERVVEIFGYARSEIIGKSIEVLVPPAQRFAHEQHRKLYFNAPKRRPMGARLAIAGIRKDGSEIPLDVAISYIEGEGGIMGMAFIRERV